MRFHEYLEEEMQGEQLVARCRRCGEALPGGRLGWKEAARQEKLAGLAGGMTVENSGVYWRAYYCSGCGLALEVETVVEAPC